jgi:hypothetical protein
VAAGFGFGFGVAGGGGGATVAVAVAVATGVTTGAGACRAGRLAGCRFATRRRTAGRFAARGSCAAGFGVVAATAIAGSGAAA